MARRNRGNAEPARMTESQLRRQAIQGFRDRVHHHPYWADMEVLARSGIKEEVEGMLRVSGWPGVLGMYSEADVDDTSEFLGTFRYIGREGHQGISYRHRNHPYECTMDQIREVFGWPVGGIVYDMEILWSQIWRVIAPTNYDDGCTQAGDITNPAIFYLHHLLSKTLFARKNLDKVGRLEMAVLAMLQRGESVHWGHYWCSHMDQMRSNSPIACGGMVTYFLKHRHHQAEIPAHTTLFGKWMDYTYFKMGRNIERAADGGYQWIYFRDVTLRPPPVAPRGRRRARGNALVIHDGNDEQPQVPQPDPQPAQQPPPGLFNIDAIFNTIRASIYAGRPFQWMPAPEGWRMGDPIPPEYLQ